MISTSCWRKPVVLRVLPSRIESANRFSLFPAAWKNHYESLGVSRNATHADIKAAYYKLSKLYHPDKNETPEAAATFRNITEAYEVIGNFKLRKMYDKGLLGHVADEGNRRTYANYNAPSSKFKNRPSHYTRADAFNFDEWSRFHYGDVLNRRHSAKKRYEAKVYDTDKLHTSGKNENVAFLMLSFMVVVFAASYYFKESFDEPNKSVPRKNS